MSQRLPVNVHAEYRGSKPAGQFTARDTGEVIAIPEKLRFEFDNGEGPDLLEVSLSALDKVKPAFDASVLKKGDTVHILGVAVIPEKGSPQGGFFSITACSVVEASKLKAA